MERLIMQRKNNCPNTVVILGSKPNAALPDVAASVVLGANASIEIGLNYREHYNSYLISFVGSGELKNKIYVQKAIEKSEPDEVIVHGEKMKDPRDFIIKELGLSNAHVHVMSFNERYKLMAERVGFFAPLVGMKTMDINSIKKALKDYFGPRSMKWSYCSTGMYSIIYAMKRFSEADKYISAGIGLQGGGHYYGTGEMRTGRAKVDRRVMKCWKSNQRSNLYTTDEAMSQLGDVPLWTGSTFFYKD